MSLVTTEAERAPSRRDATPVFDVIPVLDTARFEHMQRVATVIARSALVPDTLCKFGKKDNRRDLAFEVVMANCFLVVNQAVRWGMDPFAVIQCTSVVHGKLCYEGKLVAAVIEAKLGISLDYEWDEKAGDALGITVRGKLPNGRVREVKGTVGDWKTTGEDSPWKKRARQQLAYRGSREWARLWAPGIMLGVYTDDELSDLQDNARANRAQNVTPPRPVLLEPAPASEQSNGAQPGLVPPRPVMAAPPPKPAEDAPDYDGMLAALDDEMASCEAPESLEEAREQAGWITDAPTEVQLRASDLYEMHKDRIARQDAA